MLYVKESKGLNPMSKTPKAFYTNVGLDFRL